MHNTRLYIIIIICTIFMFSCFGKDPDIAASPDTNAEDGVNDSSEDLNVMRNMPEIIKALRMDIILYISVWRD